MGPLEGIRVLDISKYGPTRYSSMILGDLGAEVIVVDMPGSAGQTLDVVADDMGALYIGHNRSKKSIALNLKKEEGKEVLYRLVEKADVLIENNRPGVLRRRGMDYETMSGINPRLIYCSMTGYGQDGPYAQRTGHEINFAGIAGIMALTGSRNGPPVYLQSPSVADLLGGVTHAVIAVLAALYSREATGRGQHIDVSITDGSAFYHWIDAQEYLLNGNLPARAESSTGSDTACMNVYQAKDGKYFTLGCAEPWLWEGVCRLVGREDFSAHQYDFDKQREMYEAFAEVFATRDRDEWVRLLDEIGVGVGPVYDLEEMFADPHFVHRGITTAVDHPKRGRINVLNTPFKFSETPAEVRSSSPLRGQHTTEVLSHILGYGDEEVARLMREGVVE
jgi:crotonobetainyl-CoA:carnitine CoA-transferase CaiB-like acyl-CoA transferase